MAPAQRISAYPVRVLVVGSARAWRGTIASLLTDQGFDVKEADTADSARAQLTEQWPEVLVLDLQAAESEEHSSDQARQVLRALAERPNRPGMVVFADDPSSPLAQAASELGAVAVLDRHDLQNLPIGESLGWHICRAWHWRRRQPAES
jgi:CheY-like chemotaxis protein